MLRRCLIIRYKLMVVESPSKATKIRELLGGDWNVIASNGHLLDLRSVDPVTFEPTYVVRDIQSGRAQEIAKLAKGSKGMIYLATDPDREGECIAHDLTQLFNEGISGESGKKYGGGLKGRKVGRVCLREITAREIEKAVKSPAAVCMDLVHAAQTRRIIDMWFGFGATRLLNGAHPGCKSAGRVQSPALRYVVERGRQNQSHEARHYHTVSVSATLPGGRYETFVTQDGKQQFKSEDLAKSILQTATTAQWRIGAVNKETTYKPSVECFDTAACVASARKVGLTVDDATRCLQELYEMGAVTYIRTDSTRIADEAVEAITKYITKQYGVQAVGVKGAGGKKKSKALNVQDAHEAIRPTDISRTPEKMAQQLGVRTDVAEKSKKGLNQKSKLYNLYASIWRRTVSSVMERPAYEKQTVELTTDSEISATVVRTRCAFPGYELLTGGKKEGALPEVVAGSDIEVKPGKVIARKTAPPALLSDADLIKVMKAKGIGRPSTYNKIVQTLTGDRGYAVVKGNNLVPTPTGENACDFMAQAFARWVDDGYTSRMESKLDDIAEGKTTSKSVLTEFRAAFSQDVQNAPDVKSDRCKILGADPETGLSIWAHSGVSNSTQRPWVKLQLGETGERFVFSPHATIPSPSIALKMIQVGRTNPPSRKSFQPVPKIPVRKVPVRDPPADAQRVRVPATQTRVAKIPIRAAQA
eukprot:Hpha_TRINITY_DN15760_c3_g6::TRINITY_DN15760_c3_g6_i1::g.39719::m.39719/K03168/topA; DNA topoisomerase I